MIDPCANCTTSQLIEDGGSVIVGDIDASLDEHGNVTLTQDQTTVNVVFSTPKAGENYRFEYLYVDSLALDDPGSIIVPPPPGMMVGNIAPVPIIQTMFGFTVNLVGGPIMAGFILRWRVVVVQFAAGVLDQPERLYLQLPMANVLLVTMANPRSDTDYGFDELRVENLVDDPSIQTPIAVQVIAKNQTSFTIALSPTPPNSNYFLTVRLP